MRILPVYKGYSVDVRLRQFRKARVGKMVEFIDFDSPVGHALFCDMVRLNQSSDENHMHYATNYVGFTCASV